MDTIKIILIDKVCGLVVRPRDLDTVPGSILSGAKLSARVGRW